LNQQLQTDWSSRLDELLSQAHPLHAAAFAVYWALGGYKALTIVLTPIIILLPPLSFVSSVLQ